MTPSRISASLITVLLVSGPALAADPIVPPARKSAAAPVGWSDSAELGVSSTTGNADSRQLAFRNTLTRAWSDAEFVFDVAGLVTQAKERRLANADGELEVSEDLRTRDERLFVGSSYRNDVSRGLFWYLSGRWVRDTAAGVDRRLRGGTGAGYRFVDSERETLSGEIGLDLTEEDRIDRGEETFGNLRSFAGYTRQLGRASGLDTRVEILYNVEEPKDVRANASTSVTAALNGTLSLRTTYSVRFDNRPVVESIPPAADEPGEPILLERERVDSILATSLVVSF